MVSVPHKSAKYKRKTKKLLHLSLIFKINPDCPKTKEVK